MGIFRDDDDRDDYETWEWKIGDPVDDANGGSMDAQNWICGPRDTHSRRNARVLTIPKLVNIHKNPWNFIMI